MPDLHSRIASELSRRLEVAKAAAPAWGDVGVVVEAGADGAAYTAADTTVAHVRLHDPADSIRRYEAYEEILSHADSMFAFEDEATDSWSTKGAASAYRTVLRLLAASLGLDTEGSTTDG